MPNTEGAGGGDRTGFKNTLKGVFKSVLRVYLLSKVVGAWYRIPSLRSFSA